MKHTLTFDGAPFDAKGKRINSKSGTSGEGRALCGCGWLSGVLPSRAARKTAHSEHKAAAEAPKETKQPAKTKQPELKGATTTVEYNAPKVHWKFFREISVNYANSVDGVTGATYDNSAQSITVAGSASARKSVAKALPKMWKQAEVALREHDKTRADEIKELNKTPQGRRSRIPAEGEFLAKYCNDVVEAGLF